MFAMRVNGRVRLVDPISLSHVDAGEEDILRAVFDLLEKEGRTILLTRAARAALGRVKRLSANGLTQSEVQEVERMRRLVDAVLNGFKVDRPRSSGDSTGPRGRGNAR